MYCQKICLVLKFITCDVWIVKKFENFNVVLQDITSHCEGTTYCSWPMYPNNAWAGISFDDLYSCQLLMCTCFSLAHGWKAMEVQFLNLGRVRPKSHIFYLKILGSIKVHFGKKLKVVIKNMVMEWKLKHVKIM